MLCFEHVLTVGMSGSDLLALATSVKATSYLTQSTSDLLFASGVCDHKTIVLRIFYTEFRLRAPQFYRATFMSGVGTKVGSLNVAFAAGAVSHCFGRKMPKVC